MGRHVDLHLHSSASDGDLSPSEVIDAAAGAGLAAVALTDHDSVAGVGEAAARAGELGLAFCPGVEMTAYRGSREIHILGLFIDHEGTAILGLLKGLKAERLERSERIAGRLRSLGLEITAGEINARADDVPGRMHVAKALLERGYVSTIEEAFQRYIGDRGPGYVEKRRLTPAEVIEAVREAGGLAAYAHPGLTNRDELIPEMTRLGLEAIEVYYAKHSARQTAHYRRLAAKNGLLETGGSDFHGPVKPDVSIGVPPVPYEVYERLCERAGARYTRG